MFAEESDEFLGLPFVAFGGGDLMRVYEFTAPCFAVDAAVPFLGFANNTENRYFWMQRGEESPPGGVSP